MQRRMACLVVHATVVLIFAGRVHAGATLTGTWTIPLLAMTPALVLQLVILRPYGRRWWMLAALAVCTIAPGFVTMSAPPSYLIASILLIAPPRVRWGLAGGWLLVIVALSLPGTANPGLVPLATWAAGSQGMLVFGLAKLAELATVAQRASDDLARRAVENDRLRAAQVVQAWLVERLSAFLVKGHLVEVLIARDARRAAAEAGQLADMARSTIREMRALMRDYRGQLADLPPGDDSAREQVDMAPRLAIGLAVTSMASIVTLHIVARFLAQHAPSPVFTVFMSAALAVSILPLLRPALRLGPNAALYTLCLAATGLPGGLAYLFEAMWIGLGHYGLIWLAVLSRQLYAMGEEQAATAIAREHRRVAQDVHDLLGFTLSAISLKASLVNRLAGACPKEAAAHIADAVQATSSALRESVIVIGALPDLSLHQEARDATTTLDAAGIHTRVRITTDDVSRSAETVLAIVLREGVANTLRHSSATWCEITATREEATVRLTVVNDGAGSAGSPAGDGAGLSNLADRLSALGGGLKTEIDGRGCHRLIADVPGL